MGRELQNLVKKLQKYNLKLFIYFVKSRPPKFPELIIK